MAGFNAPLRGRFYAPRDKQSTLLWHFPDCDPRTIQFDTKVRYFVAGLNNLQDTIESLNKAPVLSEFASRYPILPDDLRQKNCVSYHQLALKDAQYIFTQIMYAANGINVSGPGLPERLLSDDISKIRIDSEQIERHWDAVIKAAAEGISFNLTGVSAQLKDECDRTERATVLADATGKATDKKRVGALRSKESTCKGDAKAKIIAALTLHHEYQDGSCLNQEPIGVRELNRQANVSASTVSAFFNKKYGKGEGRKKKDGHKRYCNMCRDTSKLIMSLKMLNDEYSPSLLYGDNPPGEGCRDDDE